MDHRSFKQAWKDGELSITVDRGQALRVANSKVLPNRYRFAHIFWSTVWLFSILAGIVLIFTYKWWVGLFVVFVVSPVISGAVKTSAMEFMIDYSMEDEIFYNSAVGSGLLKISAKDQSEQ